MLFVVSGLARAYCLDENGREFNWSFHFNDGNVNPTNVFAIDYASYIAHQPSRLYIEGYQSLMCYRFRGLHWMLYMRKATSGAISPE